MDLGRFLDDFLGEPGKKIVQSIGRFSVSGTMMEYEANEKRPTNAELESKAISYAHIVSSILSGRNSLGISSNRDSRRRILYQDPEKTIGVVYVGGDEGIFVEFSSSAAHDLGVAHNVLEAISGGMLAENRGKQEVIDLGGPHGVGC